MAKVRAYAQNIGLHYMNDDKWLSGELCYWRNSYIYSEKTKKSLEKRMRLMTTKKKNGSPISHK